MCVFYLLAIFIMTLRDTICGGDGGGGGGVFINSNWRRFFFYFCEPETVRGNTLSICIFGAPKRETRFAFLGPPGCEEELPEATGRVG